MLLSSGPLRSMSTATSSNNLIPTFKLSDLHDRYFEYASLLSSQGVVKEAMVLLKLTLGDNTGPGSAIRERLLRMKFEPSGTNTIKIDRKALPPQPSLPTA
ncbi:hypothetical protein EDD18DRAFT_442651 [Armillaria luteobubalina]|uniref:Uncharacterized protein n=1 Tax=Armillaria luteobubalina TaxID=153913 RepID=A0AA39PYJ9_9AGAR|nr:hypothetical protein EDD18DRAFT_442651 [Armillaria luteobubalina]